MAMPWIAGFMMKAPVNKIIPFSNVDGPGNRCAIFFQSCPFACLYCHNPETIQMCNNCGSCVSQCPTQALTMEEGKVHWNQDLCVNCDTCIHTCPHLSSPKIQWMDVDELCQRVKKYRLFIRGITVSGGECMNQAAFLEEFFQKVRNWDLGILIDSNGFYDFSHYSSLLNLCDGVMLDVKAANPAFHQTLCAQDNHTVLKNLEYLLSVNKLAEVRTVLLPHHEKENRETIAYVVKHIDNRCRYKLIAYRSFGVRSAGVEKFGSGILNEKEMKEYEGFAKSLGNVTTTIV